MSTHSRETIPKDQVKKNIHQWNLKREGKMLKRNIICEASKARKKFYSFEQIEI